MKRRSLFKRKTEVLVADNKYCAIINEKPTFFDTKDAMLKGIEEFSKFNTIYSISLYRYDLYNLLNQD